MSILDEIYEGLTDDEAFASLPARIQALVPGTRYCTLLSVEDSGRIGFLIDTPRYTPDEILAFTQSDLEATKNPFRAPIEAQGLSNRALTSAAFLSPAELERTEFFNEVWRPIGEDTTHLLFAKLDFRGGYGVVSLQRGRRQDAFSEAEVTKVQPVIPHLRRLLGVRGMLAMQGRSTVEALALASHAILVTDSSGRLVMANPEGEALLEPAAPLAIRDGRVRARGSVADARLQNLLHEAGCGLRTHGGAMLLVVDETRSLRLVVAPWHEGANRRVVILIDDPERRRASVTSLLMGLYGFTTAEAGTVARLAEGLSPAGVAQERGVSLATVRAQIHHALQKSDARTIADLVRLAVSLPKAPLPAA